MFLRTLAVLTLASTGLIAVPAASHAAAAPTATAPTATEQCSLPIAHRQGHWFCQDADAPLAHDLAQRQLADHPAAARDSYCENNRLDCWFVYDNAHASFYGGGTFGVGDHPLGSVHFEVDLTSQGAQLRSFPVEFSPSADTDNTLVDGLLSSAHQEIPPAQDPSTVGTFSLGGTAAHVLGHSKVYWTPNGYKSYNTRYRTKAHVHAFTWSVADAPGGWYAWQSSPVAYSDGKGNWWFHTAHPQDLNSPHNQAGYAG